MKRKSLPDAAGDEESLKDVDRNEKVDCHIGSMDQLLMSHVEFKSGSA